MPIQCKDNNLSRKPDYGKVAGAPSVKWDPPQGLVTRYAKLRVALAPGMPERECPPPGVIDPDMHHDPCVVHAPRCKPGSLTSGFFWSRWRRIHSRHSWRMLSTQFCISGKRPKGLPFNKKHGGCCGWTRAQETKCKLWYKFHLYTESLSIQTNKAQFFKLYKVTYVVEHMHQTSPKAYDELILYVLWHTGTCLMFPDFTL